MSERWLRPNGGVTVILTISIKDDSVTNVNRKRGLCFLQPSFFCFQAKVASSFQVHFQHFVKLVCYHSVYTTRKEWCGLEQKRRKHLGIRVPEDVYTGLKVLAEKDNRSMNKELLFLVRCAVEQYEIEQLSMDSQKQGFLQKADSEPQ